MKTNWCAALTAAILVCGMSPAAGAAEAPKEKQVMTAKGTFEVKLTPQGVPEGYGRMTLDKTWSGDLEGKSQGEMLSTMSEAVKGSGAYVAIEKVNAKLGGKTGTFVFHHTGVMTRGVPALKVEVVPDSGTGELAGLAGSLTIDIRDGKHFYEFAYTLDPPAAPAAP